MGSPEFQQLLAETRDLSEFRRRTGNQDYFVIDQWQLEELAKVLERCRVKVVSDGLSAEDLKQCFRGTGSNRGAGQSLVALPIMVHKLASRSFRGARTSCLPSPVAPKGSTQSPSTFPTAFPRRSVNPN